jgi:hypothetical protein
LTGSLKFDAARFRLPAIFQEAPMKIHAPIQTTVLVAMLVAANASAVELPAKKVGLWETSSLSSAHPGTPVRVQMCFDADTDHQLSLKADASLKKMGCAAAPVQFVGGNYIYDSTCKLGARTMRTHSVISYPSGGSIHGLTTMNMGDGAPPTTMTSDSKWIGVCKPGQKPGEGEIMNMADFSRPNK